jgi:hypothetical protein
VKLTALDIHNALQPHQKYSEVTTTTRQDRRSHDRDDRVILLFYLNHPIQFIQVIGVVVVLEDYFEKFWLFTVDDSSGATIDVTCRKPEKPANIVQESKSAQLAKQGKPDDVAQPSKSSEQLDEDVIAEQTLQTTLSSLAIGTVVQAKGTLTTFRSTRQLSLIRLAILPNTSHELALISSRTEFISSTLSKPWLLSSREQRRLQQEAQGEHQERDERDRKRKERRVKMKEREERHAKVIRDEYEADELRRQEAAEEARRAAEKLHTKKKKKT